MSISIIPNQPGRQYDALLRRLCAHVNNLPLACKLPKFTEEITKTLDNLAALFIDEPDYFQQFIKLDLPQRVQLWLKNTAIYLFLKQKFQMNIVRMDNKCVFLNINSIYLNCNNEDNYYIDRCNPDTPASVDYVFSAIQQFLKQYTRSGFLDIGKDQAVTIDMGKRRYEIIYRTNFFVEGGRIFLYNPDDQALLDAVQRIDFNGILDTVFENPVLSGKNFYDLFLLAHVAQQFLMGALQDQQMNTPLFQDALTMNQLDAKKALRFLASVVTNEIPNLYQLRELLNKPLAPEWKTYQQILIANLKQQLLAPLSFSLLNKEKAGSLLSSDNWNDNWGALTLMDLLSLPANLIGTTLNSTSQLPLDQITNSDYQIATYLVYKPLPTFTFAAENLYEPRLMLTVESSRPKGILGLRSPLEVALPPHLLDFLTRDLRISLNTWARQMANWNGLATTDNTPLSAFLTQVTIAQFFEDVVGDQDLSRNFSRRLGYYFWRVLRKLTAMTNPYIRTLVQGFLKKQMYLVDTDMR